MKLMGASGEAVRETDIFGMGTVIPFLARTTFLRQPDSGNLTLIWADGGPRFCREIGLGTNDITGPRALPKETVEEGLRKVLTALAAGFLWTPFGDRARRSEGVLAGDILDVLGAVPVMKEVFGMRVRRAKAPDDIVLSDRAWAEPSRLAALGVLRYAALAE